MKNVLKTQKKSRTDLANAVRRYVSLRGGDGVYEDTVRCKLRDGQDVAVFVTLHIIPDELA